MKKQFPNAAAQGTGRAFTLIEMLISIAVLALLVLLVTQVVNSAATVARTGSKHIDTDTQGRVILDRMAIDFAQMLKRPDVDCYLKGPASYTGHGNGHAWGRRVQTGQQGSDQIAFFSQVPGYYPTGVQSPISLVAYRVNQSTNVGNPSYLRLQRMGKGLLWNGVSNATNPSNSAVYPIVFLPQTIASVGSWSAAIINNNSASSTDSAYETIGPQIFRFEYYYLLKNGNLTDIPWDTTTTPPHTSLNGFTDVEAIAVAFAAIDPASRALIPVASLFDLASDMADFRTAPGRGFGGAKKAGDLENYWKGILFGSTALGLPGVVNTGQTSSGSPVPPAAVSAIRIYNRYIDVRTL
jgi:prepilin-type N-terminal cleavage/methylation domain-containing protein